MHNIVLAQQTVTVTTPGSGSVIVPAGITELKAECWGGGGAGGQKNREAGAGKLGDRTNRNAFRH
ncbi:MAG: hypothetical protein ACKO5C_02045 [Ferruginibacter sp.]